MKAFRLIALGATALAVVALLLPFVSFPVAGPIDGITGDAWPALIPLLAVTIVLLATRWDGELDPGPALVTVLCSGSSLLFSAVKMSDATLAARDAAGATLGPGSIVLGGAVAVATAAVALGALTSR